MHNLKIGPLKKPENLTTVFCSLLGAFQHRIMILRIAILQKIHFVKFLFLPNLQFAESPFLPNLRFPENT